MMPSFEYTRARSVDDAIALLSAPNARIHAGGTDLLGCLRERIFPVGRVVALKNLHDLSGITENSGGVHVGALTTIRQLAASPTIANLFPGLAMAAGEVASPQLRNQGTVGGNLCQKPRCWYYRGDFNCLRKGGNDCFAINGENRFHCIVGGDNCYMVHPSDVAPMLMALGASVTVKGPKGTRRIPIENLHVRPADDPRRETVLDVNEIITEAVIPRPSPRHYSYYRKIRARRSWDFALAGIALSLQFDGPRVAAARVVLSGAAPFPWRSREVEEAITGRNLDDRTIANAASVVMKQATPLSQNAYKIRLFEAAIEEELKRAAGKGT
jgi:xanthine dehydrogenase YagS FAD-binding subunit